MDSEEECYFMTDAKNLLSIAHRALDLGVELFMQKRPTNIYSKSDRDFVSDLDLSIEQRIRSFLANETPEIAFLGEEEGWSSDADGHPFWVLDPIDGTSNFIRNIPLCGISLSLISSRDTTLGVVDIPYLNKRYHAISRGGAYCGDVKITSRQPKELFDAIVSLGDYAVGKGAKQKNQLRLKVTERLVPRVQRVRMLGTAALDLAWVAEGRTDAAIILSNKPWDTAAGVLIAREAGALVLDIDGLEHTYESSTTIAVAPQIADNLLEVLRDISSH